MTTVLNETAAQVGVLANFVLCVCEEVSWLAAAVCCSLLQCIARVLQYVAVYSSVLQRVATWCSVGQCSAAVGWSLLQCVAACRSVLQCADISRRQRKNTFCQKASQQNAFSHTLNTLQTIRTVDSRKNSNGRTIIVVDYCFVGLTFLSTSKPTSPPPHMNTAMGWLWLEGSMKL